MCGVCSLRAAKEAPEERHLFTNGKVHNITTTDEPNGVFLHGNSTNVVLDAVTVTGGRTGILEEKTTSGLQVTGSTLTTAHVAGMEIGGHNAAPPAPSTCTLTTCLILAPPTPLPAARTLDRALPRDHRR